MTGSFVSSSVYFPAFEDFTSLNFASAQGVIGAGSLVQAFPRKPTEFQTPERSCFGAGSDGACAAAACGLWALKLGERQIVTAKPTTTDIAAFAISALLGYMTREIRLSISFTVSYPIAPAVPRVSHRRPQPVNVSVSPAKDLADA